MGCVISREVPSEIISEVKEERNLSAESNGKIDEVSARQAEGNVVEVQNGENQKEEKDGDDGVQVQVPRPRGGRRRSKPNPRLSNPPKHLRGEQVAAGWPPWLTAVCGEAISGWIPRKADTFEKIDKIGQGTYSNVYKAKDMLTGKIVALKKVRFDNLEPESVKFMAREILILRRLDHPNVVKLEGLVTSRMSCSLYLVFDYMEHDLAGLAASPGIKFAEPQVKCYMHQLLSGLEHCHNHRVLHRDIKGSNLLIDNGGILKIADFGLASFFDPNRKQPMTNRAWKVEPLRFEERDMERARTWTVKNPRHRYEVLTDDNTIDYVEEHFGPSGYNRPDIVSTYKALNARIIQADLLRYIVMYVEGGVYTDIDVEAIKGLDQFIPKRYNEKDVNMVIGVETDEPDFQDHPILGSKAQSFCQWTFMCKPRLPVMMRLIDNILIWLHGLSQEQNVPISEIQLDFDQVLSGTGPSAFTEAILAQMSETEKTPITWSHFHDLEESKLVGGVLVLPSEAFAAGTGHSQSGNHGGRAALVKHHFHASSWPSQHPRYRHPIYGEVERCNWDMECVKLWDANTAFFAALPEDEQLKMIAIKDLDAKKMDPNSEEAHISPPKGHPATEPPEDLPDDLLEGLLDDDHR